MEIKGKNILVLGGYGEIGIATVLAYRDVFYAYKKIDAGEIVARVLIEEVSIPSPMSGHA